VDAGDGLVLRVRVRLPASPQPGAAWLTLKATPPGENAASLARLEFEYPIPVSDGEALLSLSTGQLNKRRYGLDLGGGDWVLDVFEGANAPLVVAEVELLDPAQPLELPGWCAREITGRHELSNAALARRPFQHWSRREREEVWPTGDGDAGGSSKRD
jgi:CYTH domain-containing protein